MLTDTNDSLSRSLTVFSCIPKTRMHESRSAIRDRTVLIEPPPVTPLPHTDSLVMALSERAEALAGDLVDTITTSPTEAEYTWVPPPEAGSQTCMNNLVSVLRGSMLGPSAFDEQSAFVNGVDRARQRMAVSTIIESDRIAFRRLWRLLVDEVPRHPNVDVAAMHHMTANLHAVEEIFATAMFAGYREERRRQAVEEMSQGTSAMDTLLHGHAHDNWRLWEIANCLHLPTKGPFVVIAADVPCVGYEALPNIASKLRSLDVFSAWRLMPDLQVGIAHVASERHRDNIIGLLGRVASGRIGVSACFEDLLDTPIALHFAKVSLRGPHEAGANVAVFDGSMLATAAVSAPSVMVKSASTALNGFSDLPYTDREILTHTFQTWLDNDASVRATAEALFCHPNTVRKRLHRIERHTGRRLSRPRDLIELSLAFEVQHRLI